MASFWRSGNNQQAAPEPPRSRYPPVAQPVGTYGVDMRNQAAGTGAGQGQYPRVAQPVDGPSRQPPPVPQPQFQAGVGPGTPGIRVAIQEHYRLTPPLQLPPHTGAVPMSTLQFDFNVEREVLRGAGVMTSSSNSAPHTPRSNAEPFPSDLSVGRAQEQLLEKYRAMGLSEEAVVLGLANYGDETESVKKFCQSFESLRDMGFPSQEISLALAMYDNDYNRALAHLLR